MVRIESKTLAEVRVRATANVARTLTNKVIEHFAVLSADASPAHVDDAFVKSDVFQRLAAQGMWGGALNSAVPGTQRPGPGTVNVDQSLHFCQRVRLGDTVTVSVRVRKKDAQSRRIGLDCQVLNQRGEQLIAGIARSARVPIIRTSRADEALTRLGSCAIALPLARQQSSSKP